MKLSRPFPLLALLASTLMCLGVNSYGMESQTADQSSTLKGRATAYGPLSEEIQARMGFKCVADKDGIVVVLAVRSGTPASKGKIQAGDCVLNAQAEGNFLALTIRRDGKILKARLKGLSPGDSALVAQAPKTDQTPRKPFTLNAQKSDIYVDEAGASQFALRSDKGFKLLADYNIELIVDRSMSMHERDCPGGLSRWQWLGVQSKDLANSLSPYVPNGLTIIPFASEYDVFEHATARDIDQIFNGVGQQFGTRLFEPLAERFDHYFTHYTPATKPLLIVVLTDGLPMPRFEPGLVTRELIEASQHMTSPWQATVIFGQIGGHDRAGEEYLSDLERNLTTYGAHYPFVHTISFDTLQARGLGPALVAAIQRYAPMYAQLSRGTQAPQPVIANRIQRYLPSPQVQQWMGNQQKQLSPPDADIDVSDFNDPLASDGNFRRPDRFVDHPQVDPNGARHFANGKHFDLSNTPVATAIDAVRASSLNDMPPGPRRRFKRGFPNPLWSPMAGRFPGRQQPGNGPFPFNPGDEP